MKKRNEEGYVLVYVMVVIFTVCFIALALMSNTLRTLQAQESMVQRMKDKYEAMGAIERLVAELEASSEALASDKLTCGSTENTVKQAKVDFIEHIKDRVAQLSISDEWKDSTLTFVDPRQATDTDYASILGYDYYVTVSRFSSNKQLSVDAKIHLNFTGTNFSVDTKEDITEAYRNWEEQDESSRGEAPTKYEYSYQIQNVTFDFLSYEFSSSGGDAE